MKISWPDVLKKLGLALVLFLFIRIAFFGDFIDEQENLVAGWLIFKGLVPYRDFFFHHAPLPFFMASLLFPWAQSLWWLWRIVPAVYALLVGAVVWRQADKRFHIPLLLTGGLLALAAPKHNLEMFLADSFFAFSLLGSVTLLMSWWQFKKPRCSTVLKWLLFFCFVSCWSTVTAIFPFGFLLLVFFWGEYRQRRSVVKLWQSTQKAVSWFLFSSAIFPLYFIFNHGLREFWWSVVTYNQQYYFPLRLAVNSTEAQQGIVISGVLRFAQLIFLEAEKIIQVIVNFLTTFKGIIFSVGSVSFAQLMTLTQVWLTAPFTTLSNDAQTVLVFAFVTVTLILLLRKNWKSLVGFIVLSSLLYLRNNELFHLGALFALVFWLESFLFVRSLKNRRYFSALLLGFSISLGVLHFSPSYSEHFRNRQPIVSSAKQAMAQQITQLTPLGSSLQVIGGTTVYYLLSGRLPANRYLYYFPWFSPVDKIRGEILSTVKNKKADAVIVEEFFDPELVKLVETTYSKTAEEIYQ